MAKIFLIGMMGTGKSHWSEKWARLIKSGHYDLDHLIETLEEQSIQEIFTDHGEEYFRKIETEVLRWFGEKKSFVLATGGGAACHHNNIQWMNKNGITIWLDEPLPILIGRLRLGKAQRPLLRDLTDEQMSTFLENKLIERMPFYSQAKYRLTGNNISNMSFKKILKENE